MQLAGSPLSSDSVTKQIRSEERDDTRRALDAVWEEEQVKFIEDNATACDSSPLNQYQRRFSQMSRRSMSTSVREVGNDSVSERLFTISTRTCVARFLSLEAGCATITGSIRRAASSQMLDKRGMVLWSNLFHIGILGIFFGHLFGMLTPHWMYAWFLPVAVKQQMAMILGGICGVLTLIGGAGLLVRRLTNPRIRVTSSGADILILAILLIQCILGLTTIPFSAQHPDGSEMMKLVGWAQSIVTFEGRCIYAS